MSSIYEHLNNICWHKIFHDLSELSTSIPLSAMQNANKNEWNGKTRAESDSKGEHEHQKQNNDNKMYFGTFMLNDLFHQISKIVCENKSKSHLILTNFI